MKILFLTDGFYPFQLGGMQKHNTYLIQRFANTPHHYTIFFTCKQKPDNVAIFSKLFESEKPKNIEFIYVEWPKIPKFPGHYLLASWIYSKKISKIIKKSYSDATLAYNKGFAAWHLISSKPKFPIISQLHGLEMFQEAYSLKEKLEKYLLRFPAKKILQGSDYHFAYGGKIQEILLKLHIPAENIFTQYGAVNDFWMHPNPPNKENGLLRKFLFIARYETRKGHTYLHEALKSLNQKNLPFEIVIVGDVPQDKQILSKNVIYTGNQTAEQIKIWCETAEVLLVTSLSEGFPTILVECMARGLACIATDVGAISSCVNESNGTLIPAGSVTDIEIAMIQFIQMEKSTLQQKQEAAKEMIQSSFNWDSRFADLLLHLEKIANDYR